MLKHILLLAHIRAYYFSERQGRRKDSIQTFFFLFLIYNAECPWIKIENQECELEFKEFLGTVLEAERFLQVSFIPLCLFIFPKRIFLSPGCFIGMSGFPVHGTRGHRMGHAEISARLGALGKIMMDVGTYGGRLGASHL